MKANKKKTSLDYSVDKLMKLKDHARSIMALVKRGKLSQERYLSLRKEMQDRPLFQNSPHWVQREVNNFLSGGIEAFTLFDIVFVYTINGETVEVRSERYKEIVDYSKINEFEKTGRLVWKEDFTKQWF